MTKVIMMKCTNPKLGHSMEDVYETQEVSGLVIREMEVLWLRKCSAKRKCSLMAM